MVDKYPNETPRIDWAAIEADYKAGILNDGMICAKWGISLSNLRRVANKHQWKRQEIAHVNPPPFGGGTPAGNTLSDTEVAGMQARQLMAIVHEHRRDIQKIRGLASLLFERTMLILDGQEVSRACFGGRESPADMMMKLAKTMFEAIKMEREVLGMSSMTQLSDPEAVDGGEEWHQVVKKLDELYKEKVGKSHDD